jgi:peptide deformylase
MTRRIVTYGHPILRKPTRPVKRIDEELNRLIDEMVETMYAAPGVGLAANQLGSPHRLFVANPSEDRDRSKLLVMINPESV